MRYRCPDLNCGRWFPRPAVCTGRRDPGLGGRLQPHPARDAVLIR